MSNLATRTDGVRFVPVSGGGAPPVEHRQPGMAILICGVIWPAAVIAIELATRLCADALFDPVPTAWHVLAVSFVPAMNWAVWARFAKATAREERWLMFGTGAALAIAGCYALLFLPVAPYAVVGIVIYGVGLLPLGPLAAFVSALRMFLLLAGSAKAMRLRRTGAAGAVLGLAALMATEIPMVATRTGIDWAASSDPARRQRGVALLRNFGDDDLLLRLAYGMAVQPAGPLGLFLMMADGQTFGLGNGRVAPLTGQGTARELYYRVHGIAFNQVPAPRASTRQRSFADDFQFDNDLGGAEVGGRVKGLSLTQSRIDGSIAGDDATAYLEWTFEFRNVSLLDREARLEIALPPGAVVSRATLWVNGEEKEAAYGGRGEVRAAYQKVAVQQRRDPLLVTTKGADRVLAQAFPVPRGGGVIKFKLGMTAPLEIVDAGTARLVLPAIFDRNFGIGSDVAHHVWVESKQPLAAADSTDIATGPIAGDLHRISGKLDDQALTRRRQLITVARSAGGGARLARIGDGPVIAQTIAPRIAALASTSAATVIVIDGSAQLNGQADAIVAALATIPATARIGVVIAGEPVVSLPVTAWGEASLEQARQALRRHRFAGGQDNAEALQVALVALEAEPDANLLWVHGPQPQVFQRSAAGLAQTVARLARLPALTLYPVTAGPNAVLPDVPWGWSAQMLPHVGTLTNDLAGYLRLAATREGSRIVRRAIDPAARPEGAVHGSDHIVRLWTRDQVLDLMRNAVDTPRREVARQEAVALAAASQLVTPVSGAVVLESEQQYDEVRLSPAAEASVPTLPEPHEWALICIAGLSLLWLMRHRRPINRQQTIRRPIARFDAADGGPSRQGDA